MVETYLGKAAFEHFSTLLPNIWKVLGSCMIVTKVSSIWNYFKIRLKKTNATLAHGRKFCKESEGRNKSYENLTLLQWKNSSIAIYGC